MDPKDDLLRLYGLKTADLRLAVEAQDLIVKRLGLDHQALAEKLSQAFPKSVFEDAHKAVASLGLRLPSGTTLAGDLHKLMLPGFSTETQQMFAGLAKAMDSQKALIERVLGPPLIGATAADVWATKIPSTLSVASEYTLATERILAGMPWSQFGARFSLTEASRHRLLRSAGRLNKRYGRLYEDAADDQNDVDSLVAVDAPLGVLTRAQCLRVVTTAAPSEDIIQVSTDVVEATFAFVEQGVGTIKPQYATMLRGARNRVKERGPDWMRQASSSYRQLIQNVLHRTAPSDHVRQWTDDPSDFDPKGFPTHKAKVRWLCRQLQPDSLRAYMIEQLLGSLKVIGVFASAVHDDAVGVTDDEFAWIVLEAERALRRILELGGHR
jgi:hypothetical protein